MRTKALVCAAVTAAGIVTSMAQVYSLNVVGYYNVTVPANSLKLIANQFNTTNNTLGSLIPSAPVNSQFFKYVSGVGYDLFVFDEFELNWQPNGNVTLNPGEGGFFRNPDASPLTLTFVGEVPQGALTNDVPAGYSIRSSIVPQGAGLDVLGFPAQPNDQVFKWINDATGYALYVFDEFELSWQPSVPAMEVGEAFFANVAAPAQWVRNFTVQ